MKLMLDTNVVLWWFQDNPRLGPRARAMIASGSNDVLVSIASPWEISVKYRTGKLAEMGSVFLRAIGEQGFELLNPTIAHLTALEMLPSFHRDPFDHLILAQAQVEGASIMTADAVMPRYGVPCIGVN